MGVGAIDGVMRLRFGQLGSKMATQREGPTMAHPSMQTQRNTNTQGKGKGQLPDIHSIENISAARGDLSTFPSLLKGGSSIVGPGEEATDQVGSTFCCPG